MSRRDHSLPGDLQGLKPAVRSGLVAYLSPDAFLHIETGLVAGQVLDSESSMSAQKLLDLHAHMPAGSVHVEPDRIAPEPLAHLLQAIEKSRSIPTRGSHQPTRMCSAYGDVGWWSGLEAACPVSPIPD